MAKSSMWRAAALAALTSSAALIAVPGQANAPSSSSTFEARRTADAAERNADAAMQALGEPASAGPEQSGQSAWRAHLGQSGTQPSAAGQSAAGQPIGRYYDRDKVRAERARLAQERHQQQQAAAAEANRQQRLAAVRQEQARQQQAAAAEASRQQRLAAMRQEQMRQQQAATAEANRQQRLAAVRQQQRRAAWQARQRALQEAAWREHQQESRWAARDNWRDESWDDQRYGYRDDYQDDWQDESWGDERRRYRDTDREDYRRWDNGWTRNPRYDWRNYRNSNRDVYRVGRYSPPYRAYSYRSLDIGRILEPLFFRQRYWIGDPGRYRLPQVYGPYRWVRYYDDVLLIDTHSGQVADAIYRFFS